MDITKSFAEFIDVVGLKGCASLVEHFKGQRLSIPHSVDKNHPIAQVLGIRAARLLSDYAGGERVSVPMHLYDERRNRRELILRLRSEGCTIPVIASRAACTERMVYWTLSRHAHQPEAPLLDYIDKNPR